MLRRDVPRGLGVLFLMLVVLLWPGCARLEAPELTAHAVEVTRVSATGMRVRVEVHAYNPNRVSLSVKEVSATVKLDGSVNLGRASVEAATTLPAKATTRVTAELNVPWNNLLAVAPLAQQKSSIPYTVKGTARIGGKLSVEVPFTIDGTITSQRLLTATMRGLPF
jgi:LEA14-like dessication related protein